MQGILYAQPVTIAQPYTPLLPQRDTAAQGNKVGQQHTDASQLCVIVQRDSITGSPTNASPSNHYNADSLVLPRPSPTNPTSTHSQSAGQDTAAAGTSSEVHLSGRHQHRGDSQIRNARVITNNVKSVITSGHLSSSGECPFTRDGRRRKRGLSGHVSLGPDEPCFGPDHWVRMNIRKISGWPAGRSDGGSTPCRGPTMMIA